MATSTPQGSPPNAAVVIRERIKQKRLFEAQFLFGLLDEDDVSPQEKLVLERELNGLLAVVRDLQIQANKYLADGEYNLARKMHREMERIAVDVPGLEDGKRRAGQSETAAALQETAPPDPAEEPKQTPPPAPAPKSDLDEVLSPLDDLPDLTPEIAPEEAPAAEETEAAPEPAPASANKAKKPAGSSKKKLMLAAAILILALLGFLLMKNGQRETPPVAPQQPQPGQEAEVAIKPLSVRQNDDAPGQTPTAAQGSESSRITIGELTVEE